MKGLRPDSHTKRRNHTTGSKTYRWAIGSAGYGTEMLVCGACSKTALLKYTPHNPGSHAGAPLKPQLRQRPSRKTLDTLITTPHFVFEYVLHRLLSNGTRTPVVEGVVSSSIFDSYVRHIKVISVMLGLFLVIVFFRLFKMTSYTTQQIKVFVYHVNQKLLHTITHEQPSWYLGYWIVLQARL